MHRSRKNQAFSSYDDLWRDSDGLIVTADVCRKDTSSVRGDCASTRLNSMHILSENVEEAELNRWGKKLECKMSKAEIIKRLENFN